MVKEIWSFRCDWLLSPEILKEEPQRGKAKNTHHGQNGRTIIPWLRDSVLGCDRGGVGILQLESGGHNLVQPEEVGGNLPGFLIGQIPRIPPGHTGKHV